MKYSHILLVGTLVLGPFAVGGRSQTKQSIAQNANRLPYVIAFSERIDDSMRNVSVLVKPEMFTKENLVKITKLLEKRFPKPNLMYINFYSELNDIPTPEEMDGPGHSGDFNEKPAKQKTGDYAIFVRLRNGQYGNCFIYFVSGGFQEVKITRQYSKRTSTGYKVRPVNLTVVRVATDFFVDRSSSFILHTVTRSLRGRFPNVSPL